MNKITADVTVIGGGPAGMTAAYFAAMRGLNVVIAEKNKSLGKKLLITGKGRCNITNAAPIEDFFKNIPVNPRFLYSSFYNFTNTDLIDLLESYGLKTKTERGGRIFPQSDSAKDVLAVLEKMINTAGVKVLNTETENIFYEDGKWIAMQKNGAVLESHSIVVATGGVSYPLTGSTGDGYRFAEKTGHTVTDINASLVPVVFKEDYVKDLMGLSLKNIEVTVERDGKKLYKEFGEMLFTHYGASGPVVLSASAHMRKYEGKDCKIIIDLKPALDFEKLDARILRDFEKQKNKDFINSLDMLLPKKMIPVIVMLSKIPPHKKVNEITREQRHALVNTIKTLEFTTSGFRPVSEAIITGGGVSVKNINPKTMESKIAPGLFFAGEVIDVDAYTGGFNLQIAFSTGYTAGQNVY